MLREITTILLTQPLQPVHQNLVEKACDLLNVPFAVLWLVDNDQLVIQASSNPKIQGFRVNISDTQTGKAVLAGNPVVSMDAWKDIPENLAEMLNLGPCLIAPLSAPQDAINLSGFIGALSIYYSLDGLSDIEQADWDKNVLNIFAHYAVLAIQSADHQDAIRQAQERHTVSEAFAAIGDIASNLLHQLNNKIGTIPVRIEGIHDKSAGTLAADQYLSSNLSEIERSATDAIQVVRENLFLLRPIKFSAVSPKAAVETAIASHQLPSDVRILHDNLEDLPDVHACPQRLPLVFTNLLDNAVRVLQGKGEIFITGKTLEKNVEIRVRDTGPGIAHDLQEQIFEFNYSTQSPDQSGNLGFGLWWVKTLMARFGGAISVESDGRFGTTFVLELPISEDEK
jgi:signal transduction histidine kinase